MRIIRIYVYCLIIIIIAVTAYYLGKKSNNNLVTASRQPVWTTNTPSSTQTSNSTDVLNIHIPSSGPDDSFALKQQCADDTDKLLYRFNQGKNGSEKYYLVNSTYNNQYKTCFALTNYDFWTGDILVQIWDSLSGKLIAAKQIYANTPSSSSDAEVMNMAKVPNLPNATVDDFDKYQASLGL